MRARQAVLSFTSLNGLRSAHGVSFDLQVVECVNADALVIRSADGSQRKIHFSSLRPPR